VSESEQESRGGSALRGATLDENIEVDQKGGLAAAMQ
jgi:hypothetical protein